MTQPYDPRTTALLCIDFYNDFLSEGGKLWPMVKAMATELKLLDNLRTIVKTSRESGITVFHVPHHRWEPGDLQNWKNATPYQLAGAERQGRQLTCPNLNELCQRFKKYDTLAEVARELNDPVYYLAGLLAGKPGTGR